MVTPFEVRLWLLVMADISSGEDGHPASNREKGGRECKSVVGRAFRELSLDEPPDSRACPTHSL